MQPLMTKSITWLGTSRQKTFAVCYSPPQQNANDIGIVICPTIGHEYVHNHRIHNYLAEQLVTQTGSYCTRLDFWGSGDSPATTIVEEDFLSRWTTDIQNCVDYLENIGNINRICIVGFRFGAFIASKCLAEIKTKTGIDKFILWCPYQQGAAFTRDMELVSSGQPTWNTDGYVSDLGGILFDKKAIAVLSEEKIEGKALPKINNIHILQPENERPNKRLAENLGACGAAVEISAFSGYSNMMKPGLLSIVSQDGISKICHLIEENRQNNTAGSVELKANNSSSLMIEGSVKETVFKTENGCVGILSTLVDSPIPVHTNTFVFINGGAAHHAGPGRMYTNIARELAKTGITCARVDLSTLGDGSKACLNIDSPLHPFPTNFSDDIQSVLLHLKHYYGLSNFIVGGLCSAGHNAYHYCLNNPENISAVLLVNPMHFYWREGMSVVPHLDESQEASIKGMIRNLSQQRGLHFIPQCFRILAALTSKSLKRINQCHAINRIRPPDNYEMVNDLKILEKSGICCIMLFSEGEPANYFLGRAMGWSLKGFTKRKTIEVIQLPKSDHAFLLHNQQGPLFQALLNLTHEKGTSNRTPSSRFNA